ncbi:GNAT family N-acetyltransferase [Litchfieldia salsa]|uniref:Protein N-acetyltransferase, RimJ/RimL family n=1 Tax=Litchfieldia salsa TaxID=930152 RepID=A0A1H0RR44_9BACI|nr:GNAT family N-acetyltransferase [Litchfieldia salsa]SDP32021.1 Protein N-acetyltransferase, RimJ/RimL family [Litchfieldia salsa]
MVKGKELIAETERLVIRPYKNDDFNNWYSQYTNRLSSQNKYDEGIVDMSVCTNVWFQSLVEKHKKLASNDVEYIFGIFHKEKGTHLGVIDLSTLMRDNFEWARIGYTIHNQFWNRGFGEEAVRGVLEFSFRKLKFHRVEAHINIDNIPSIKLAEKVGMEFECIRKGFIYENNEWTDHLIYYKNYN